MGATRRSESTAIFFTVKDFSLWQEIKTKVPNCDAIEVTNPTTKQVLTKYGYKYASVEGLVIKLEKYDRRHEGTRYFGFKLHMRDGADLFVIDLPYNSQALRKFLKFAPNIKWAEPLSVKIFKGKRDDGKPELAVWLQQHGESVRQYYTKDNPHGMPPARQDAQGWDFREQHSWLCERFWTCSVEIQEAAKRFAPPAEPDERIEEPEPSHDYDGGPPPHAPITDDDVPF